MKHAQRGMLKPTQWGILIVGLRCANPTRDGYDGHEGWRGPTRSAQSR